MANWGEFLKEFKILNLKSQGIYVKVDEVLDLYDERAKLREELAQARDELARLHEQGGNEGSEREACARDVEEFAEACAAEPDQPEYVVTILRYAAELIRGRGQAPVAEAVEGEAEPAAENSEAEEAPTAIPVAQASPEEEPIPTAQPVSASEATPEAIPTAEPVRPAEEHLS
jgi:hypothetical protein